MIFVYGSFLPSRLEPAEFLNSEVLVIRQDNGAVYAPISLVYKRCFTRTKRMKRTASNSEIVVRNKMVVDLSLVVFGGRYKGSVIICEE